MSNATITISGNVTRNADLRFTQSGRPVAGFGVAVNERVKGPDGEWTDGEPTFVEVTAWGKLGEGAGAVIRKGERVVVTGRLRTRTWTGSNGEERRSLELVADDIGQSVLFRGQPGSYDGQRQGAAAQPQVTRGDDFAPFGGGDEEPF